MVRLPHLETPYCGIIRMWTEICKTDELRIQGRFDVRFTDDRTQKVGMVSICMEGENFYEPAYSKQYTQC